VLRKGAAALLVVDMQCYFEAIAQDILGTVRSAIEGGRRAGIPVLYTQHGHRNPTEDGGMLCTWWGDLIQEGSAEAELIAAIAPQSGERVIRKCRYSAFFGTELDTVLRSLKISDLIIAGVMTNLCCETTARDAFMRDYRVFFLADATATASEELHLAALRNLAFGFAHVVDTGEVLEMLLD
jgi:isochorismate hydrolase